MAPSVRWMAFIVARLSSALRRGWAERRLAASNRVCTKVRGCVAVAGVVGVVHAVRSVVARPETCGPVF